MMDISLTLIRGCKAKDEQAFNQLLQRYEEQLYRICFLYCHDQDEALDIMQEVFIKIFRFIDNFDESRPIMPWLKRIAVNTCLNYQRDRGKLRPVSLDGEAGFSLKDQVPSPDNVEETVIALNQADRLKAALQALPVQYRIALTLRCIEGLNYAEMATVLGQPTGTIKSNVHRGRQQLRHILSNNGQMEV